MRHVYELVSIWPGGEYVHMRSEALPPVAARYNRCKARETYPIRHSPGPAGAGQGEAGADGAYGAYGGRRT